MGNCICPEKNGEPMSSNVLVDDTSNDALTSNSGVSSSNANIPSPKTAETKVSRKRSLSQKRHPRSGSSPKSATKTQKETNEWKQTPLTKIFDSFAGEDDDADCICDDQLARFFDELGVSSELEVDVVWGLSWKLGCDGMGEITRDEFSNGLSKLRITDYEGIKKLVGQLRKDLKNNQKFNQFYNWTFDYFLDQEAGQKTLKPDDAIEYWPLLLKRWKCIDQFVEYTRKAVESKSLRAVSQDLWACVYEFSRDVKPDLSNWEDHDHGAWPSHIDGFVEYLKA